MLICSISLQGDVHVGPSAIGTAPAAQYGSWVKYAEPGDLLGALQAAVKEANDTFETKFKDTYDAEHLYIAVRKPRAAGEDGNDGPLNETGFVAWKLSLKNKVTNGV